jgi:hypothetical protein
MAQLSINEDQSQVLLNHLIASLHNKDRQLAQCLQQIQELRDQLEASAAPSEEDQCSSS